MAISNQIERLINAANVIKRKTQELGLVKDDKSVVTTADKLDLQAEAINNIEKRSAINTTITSETTSVSIPQGFYTEGGSVSVEVKSAEAVVLSNERQTIFCKDRLMNDNIVIPAANVYYTGGEIPADTLGNDGDLYLVV